MAGQETDTPYYWGERPSKLPTPVWSDVSSMSSVDICIFSNSRLKAPVHSLPSTKAISASYGVMTGARYSLLSRRTVWGHATSTNTSHSGKFANFEGFGFPMTIVYGFLPAGNKPLLSNSSYWMASCRKDNLKLQYASVLMITWYVHQQHTNLTRCTLKSCTREYNVEYNFRFSCSFNPIFTDNLQLHQV